MTQLLYSSENAQQKMHTKTHKIRIFKKIKKIRKKKKDTHTNVHGSAIRHNLDLETSCVHLLKSG